MNEDIFVSVMTSEFIYIPYNDKTDLSIKNLMVKKNELINVKDKIYSPVSGKAYAYTEIPSLNGNAKSLIIENDFLDTMDNTFQVENIYKIDKDKIKSIVGNVNSFTLKISFENKYDLKDYYILKDNVLNVLETLNLISETYDMDVSILINKKDTRTYQLLFNYMGTYPNINIIFSTKGETKSIYDVIDIFNIIKNKASRDYIYFTLINKNTLNVVKAKRYSNLKDVLVELKIVTSNLVVNNTMQLDNPNFLIDDNISLVVLK